MYQWYQFASKKYFHCNNILLFGQFTSDFGDEIGLNSHWAVGKFSDGGNLDSFCFRVYHESKRFFQEKYASYF